MAGLTWNGYAGGLSNTDRLLHLLDADGYSLCGIGPSHLLTVERRDFTAEGDVRGDGWCPACRERGFGG